MMVMIKAGGLGGRAKKVKGTKRYKFPVISKSCGYNVRHKK